MNEYIEHIKHIINRENKLLATHDCNNVDHLNIFKITSSKNDLVCTVRIHGEQILSEYSDKYVLADWKTKIRRCYSVWALIAIIKKVINIKELNGDNKMEELKASSFSLSTNLIPALKDERIDFRSVYATLCHAQSLIVMYTNIDICRVETIQDLRSSYCYKVNWVRDRDIICFPTNYKHYTALIADIKKAINRLKNEGENKMNNKMYTVTAIGFNSNPCEKDEIDFTVRVMRQRDARQEDVDRIREAIESIGETKEKIVLDHHTLLRMFNKTFIKDVIFNNPATIVLWEDGTKTVVKAENEEFDPEKGLAMAIAKKALGNGYDYYDTFKKYVGRYEKKQKKG